MNDEIREILVLQNYVSRYKSDEKAIINHSRLTMPLMLDYLEAKNLLDYITNLQQENEELKKNQRYYKNGVFSLEYDKETLSDMVDDYKSRIEKAVEYIKEHIQKYDIDGSIGDFDEFDMLTKPNYLLNILQNGSDKE